MKRAADRNKRPLAVTLIAWLYIAAGTIGVAYHLQELRPQHPFQYDIVWVSLVRLIAIVAGVYMLPGSNWARWLALAWIVFHVILVPSTRGPNWRYTASYAPCWPISCFTSRQTNTSELAEHKQPELEP